MLDQYDAFKMEYTYQIEGGLKMHGLHYGFLTKDRLYRIRYEAADQHYYYRNLNDFRDFIDSFKVL